MYFDILLYFSEVGALEDGLDDKLLLTLKSILAQRYKQWRVLILANSREVEAVDQVIQSLTPNLNTSRDKITVIKAKPYSNTDLNIALNQLGETMDKANMSHKLILIKWGDYLSGDYLGTLADFLRSLELDREGVSPCVAMTDFKFIDFQKKVFDSKFVLKNDIRKKNTFDLIYNPKLLIHPFEFIWDIGLIRYFKLRFDTSLASVDLSLVRFNLDYILAISNLNNFILPELKICPNAFYISTNPIVLPSKKSKNFDWQTILKLKQEQLQKIGGRTWWWFKLVNVCGRKYKESRD